MILPSELLRIRRSKGKIIPLYAGEDKISLAKTLISIYEDSIGKKYGDLKEALSKCEDLGYNYRLVRGLSSMLYERCAFQTRAIISPLEARKAVFEEVGGKIVATKKERNRILARVSSKLGLSAENLDASLYADLSDEQILAELRTPEPLELLREYNFSATLAILSRAREIELHCKGRLDEPTKSLGKSTIRTEKGVFKLALELRPLKRIGQQSSELERLVASLMLQDGWGISAELSSGKKSFFFETSKEKSGSLAAPKSLRKLLAKRDSKTVPREKPLGDVILVEEMATSLGVTEAEAREKLTMKGSHVDLGGVFISAGMLKELEGALGKSKEMKLSVAVQLLRRLGCRRPLPVLEALGYSVDWAENRDESRVYKLSRR